MRFARTVAGLGLAAVLTAASAAHAQIQLSPVLSGLSSPVFVGNAGDNLNRLFIVEQAGIIKVLQPGASAPGIFLDIRSRIVAGGERGLLGLAFHPQYASNGRFFVFYTRVSDGALVIAEYKATPADADTAGTDEEVLLTIPHSTFANHNGGMLAFGPDGYLYIGVGDGGGANDPSSNAQNTNTLLGKILRIDVNSGETYTSPVDNPFSGPAAGLDEIFAYGLRNPWRFSFDRETGEAWVGDVGQGSREEVDTPLVNGGNYGWRVFEGTLCTGLDPCTGGSFIAPLFDYGHSGGRCSLTGGYVYRGASGALQAGRYVYGDYCSGEIFTWNGTSQSVLLDTAMRISSFGEDEDGELYVVDLNGSISRIDPAASSCSYSVTPTRITAGPAGATGTITVTTNPGCSWTAASQASWASVTPISGSGSGSVSYTIAPYSGKPKKRNGSLMIAGQVVTVQQSR